jgi:hypothetical protein
MATADDLLKIKRTAENARQEQARAEGAKAQVMGELDREWGCKTIEAAEAKKRQLEKEAAEAEVEFNKALVDFKAQHSSILGL